MQVGPTITISGLPGAGKSTVARKIADELKLEYWSPGGHHRKQAELHGIPLEKYFRDSSAKENRKLDEEQLSLARYGKIVLDGRYSGMVCYLERVPSKRIWLEVSREVRVLRIAQRDHLPISAAMVETKQREEDEVVKGMLVYGNVHDFRKTDYYTHRVIGERKKPDQIVEELLKNL